jgi:hypothetical protein
MRFQDKPAEEPHLSHIPALLFQQDPSLHRNVTAAGTNASPSIKGSMGIGHVQQRIAFPVQPLIALTKDP